MQVDLIPLEQIYADDKFNCRGQPLGRGDVLDLIDSIKRTRLENPIVVQPLDEIKIITPPPSGVLYRVLNGNRRYTAYRALWKEDPGAYAVIPAIIRRGLSDDDARALNISDNLDRKDLTLAQEALALQHWNNAGYGREAIGRLIGQSGSWVQIRINLLELPKDFLEYAGKGMITQDDVKDLYQYRNDIDALYTRARDVISYRLKGQKPPRVRTKRQQARGKRPGRSRANVEIIEMMTHVHANIGAGLITRMMAWCAGNASTIEILPEIKQTTEILGNPYVPLDEDKLEHL